MWANRSLRRKWFVALFAINLGLNFLSLLLLPPEVAIHFGAAGKPDAWMSREFNALLFILLDLFLFAVFISIPSVLDKVPRRWLSLPNREFWLKPENRQQLSVRLSGLMDEFGIGLFVLFLLVGLLTLEANLSQPVKLNESLFLTIFIVYMLYVVYWLFRMTRRLRLPVPPGAK